MKRIKVILGSLFMVATLSTVGAATLTLQPVAAQSPEQSACEGSGGTWSGGSCTQGKRTVAGTLKNVGNIMIFLIGAISVVMIIIGGLRYTLSGGDQGTITSAKNTILYAIIGLIVSVVAYAIVNFVLSNI